MYLTALTDSPRGIDDESCLDIWTNLPYLQFSDEVEKIRRASYLRIDSLESAKEKFPQLYKKLRLSGACAAALYPIEGIDSEVYRTCWNDCRDVRRTKTLLFRIL